MTLGLVDGGSLLSDRSHLVELAAASWAAFYYWANLQESDLLQDSMALQRFQALQHIGTSSGFNIGSIAISLGKCGQFAYSLLENFGRKQLAGDIL